jgi:DNA-binding response OmpR family regulator
MSQRVLLVEADGFAGVHQVRLAQAGYTVKLVTTPAAAVGAAHVFAPDLVILDVDLVGHNEWEVASLRATSPAPLLLLVPPSASAAQIAEAAAPHTDYLTKPFTAAAFLAAMNRRSASAPEVQIG